MKDKIVNICNMCHNKDVPKLIRRGIEKEMVCDVCGGLYLGITHIDWNYITIDSYEKSKQIKSLTIII